MTHESALMTVGEVGRYLQLHRNGVRKLTRAGKLRSQQTIGGQFVFRFGDVKVYGLQRADLRITPAQGLARVRRPEGQIRLPFTGTEAPRPLPWWDAKFKPRMLKVVSKSETFGVRSHTEPASKAGRTRRVA